MFFYRILHKIGSPEVSVVLDKPKLEESWYLQTSGQESHKEHKLVCRLAVAKFKAYNIKQI